MKPSYTQFVTADWSCDMKMKCFKIGTFYKRYQTFDFWPIAQLCWRWG